MDGQQRGENSNKETASLRIQTTEANKSEFPSVSPERFVLSLLF